LIFQTFLISFQMLIFQTFLISFQIFQIFQTCS